MANADADATVSASSYQESQDMGGRVGGGGGGGGGSGGMERRRSSMRSMTHSDEEAIERQKAMLLRKIARFQKAKSSL